jgi:transcription elongation factor Elf1
MCECAQCGALILFSSWSEEVDDHRVRDVWDCLVCGYAFETEVVFPHARSSLSAADALSAR